MAMTTWFFLEDMVMTYLPEYQLLSMLSSKYLGHGLTEVANGNGEQAPEGVDDQE